MNIMHTLSFVPGHDKLMPLCVVPFACEMFPSRGIQHNVQNLSMCYVHVGGTFPASGDVTTAGKPAS